MDPDLYEFGIHVGPNLDSEDDSVIDSEEEMREEEDGDGGGQEEIEHADEETGQCCLLSVLVQVQPYIRTLSVKLQDQLKPFWAVPHDAENIREEWKQDLHQGDIQDDERDRQLDGEAGGGHLHVHSGHAAASPDLAVTPALCAAQAHPGANQGLQTTAACRDMSGKGDISLFKTSLDLLLRRS